jgi:hypothetical protein
LSLGHSQSNDVVKKGVIEYGLDVTIFHCYGANVAYFFLVMLAYNLMNWFKEGMLGQKKVKRMARWIRQRFFLIAGKLVRRGRRWILNLPKNWPWQEEYLQVFPQCFCPMDTPSIHDEQYPAMDILGEGAQEGNHIIGTDVFSLNAPVKSNSISIGGR